MRKHNQKNINPSRLTTRPRASKPKKKISWNLEEEEYQNLRSQSKEGIKEKAQSGEGANQRRHKAPAQDTEEVIWWAEEEEEEDTTEDFLPEQDIATVSQIMTLIVGDPVSISQVNQALKKVSIQEEEQEDSESSASDNDSKEEEEEGAVGSVGIIRRDQTFQKERWNSLEQDENGEDAHERFRRLQRENNPAP